MQGNLTSTAHHAHYPQSGEQLLRSDFLQGGR